MSNTTWPIKDLEEISRLKAYYTSKNPNKRNQLLVVLGLNTALRISDILLIRYRDVYMFSKHKIKTHIVVHERKTGKVNRVCINDELKSALIRYADFEAHKPGDWLFPSNRAGMPLTRTQAFRIISIAARESNLSIKVSPHSLRKTFGYHAWQRGADPVLLMDIYNHSSYKVTRRYLGIAQEEKDDVYIRTCL